MSEVHKVYRTLSIQLVKLFSNKYWFFQPCIALSRVGKSICASLCSRYGLVWKRLRQYPETAANRLFPHIYLLSDLRQYQRRCVLAGLHAGPPQLPDLLPQLRAVPRLAHVDQQVPEEGHLAVDFQYELKWEEFGKNKHFRFYIFFNHFLELLTFFFLFQFNSWRRMKPLALINNLLHESFHHINNYTKCKTYSSVIPFHQRSN